MRNVRRTLAKLMVAGMLAGSLATAGSGMAGAAVGSEGHHTRHGGVQERQRICQLERGRLAFSAHQQSLFAAQTTGFAALEAQATKAGETGLAAYWAKVVSNRDAHSSRQHARLLARTARDARAHGLVNGKCR